MKKLLIIITFLLLFIPLSSHAESRFLYDVIKNAQESGLAKEFTYSHRDSFTEEPKEKVYYWYVSTNEVGNQILEKMNVIFGGFCWQMMRTTDTGGVKLLYNGIPQDGKCNNTGNAQQIGKSKYNTLDDSLSDLGYMYNIRYPINQEYNSTTFFTSANLSTEYYYADSYEYQNLKYTLTNPFKVSSPDDYSSLVGKYTHMNSSPTYARGYLYYIAGVKDDKLYYLAFNDGKSLSHVDFNIYYGSSYTKNNDGTYTINDPTFTLLSQYAAHKEAITNKYVCWKSDTSTCEDLWYIMNPGEQSFYYLRVAQNYKYASSFTYDSATGMYTLNEDSDTFWNHVEKVQWLRNHHYTCRNESGVCDTLYYNYYMANGRMFYISLTDGKGLTEALDDMLYSDNVNQTNSTIKTYIDNWYAANLTEYTQYLEDVLFCYSRTIEDPLGYSGWHETGGRMTEKLTTGEGYRLDCRRDTDSFSMSNPKAKLTYPVGLPSDMELDIWGTNNTLRKTGEKYWASSDGGFTENSAYISDVLASGGVSSMYATTPMTEGVRPVVSLKPKTRYASGTGSKNDPYIVDYNEYYSVDVIIKNETKELNIELDDITTVSEGEQVKFKVVPIKGYKVTGIEVVDEDNQDITYQETDNKNEYTFIMPNKDVTIIPSYERTSAAVNVEDNSHTKEIKIEVNDVQAVVYEDEVRFTIIPEEGYELVSIVITDEEGNVIEYHKTNKDNEYSFIMPDTDVLIKPTYRKIEVPSSNEEKPFVNPNTNRKYLLLGLIVGICSILGMKKIKKEAQ